MTAMFSEKDKTETAAYFMKVLAKYFGATRKLSVALRRYPTPIPKQNATPARTGCGQAAGMTAYISTSSRQMETKPIRMKPIRYRERYQVVMRRCLRVCMRRRGMVQGLEVARFPDVPRTRRQISPRCLGLAESRRKVVFLWGRASIAIQQMPPGRVRTKSKQRGEPGDSRRRGFQGEISGGRASDESDLDWLLGC